MNSSDKAAYRSIFPHTQNGHIYLNHAAISPLSSNVSGAIGHFMEDRSSGNIENFENWMNTVEETRNLIATLIHTSYPERITFMGNTSDAISAVAEGLNWEPGDEIILNTMEFPSNVQPFRILERFGVKLIFLKPDEFGRIHPEQIEKSITKKTRLVSISAVQYLNGFKADLKAIGDLCKRDNLFFVVDGIQALGAMDIHVDTCGIDALATGGHKWLMAPMGTGFLYISEKLEKQLSPAKTGWLSVEVPWDLTNFNQPWLPVSKHLETGTLNISGIYGLHASLKNLLEIGTDTIRKEIGQLLDNAINLLEKSSSIRIVTPLNLADRAGILTFSKNGMESTDDFVSDLKKDRITISSREGLLRISPHYYNTHEEIETVLNKVSGP